MTNIHDATSEFNLPLFRQHSIDYMERNEITVAAAARMCGVDRKTMRRILGRDTEAIRKEWQVSLASVCRIATVFDLSLDRYRYSLHPADIPREATAAPIRPRPERTIPTDHPCLTKSTPGRSATVTSLDKRRERNERAG